MLENCSLATPDATPELESLAERDHSNRREADSHVRAHLPVRAGLSPSRDLGSLSSDHFDYGLRPQPHIPGSALRHSVVLSSHNMPKILSSWKRLPSSFLPYRHTPAVTISASGLGTKLDPIQLNEDEDEDEDEDDHRLVSRLFPCSSQFSPLSGDTTWCDHERNKLQPVQSKPPTLEALLQGKRNIAVITGAGISTSAGSESFRSCGTHTY
jgi:hypothetical protein